MSSIRRSRRIAQRPTRNRFLNFPRRNVINFTQSPIAEDASISSQSISMNEDDEIQSLIFDDLVHEYSTEEDSDYEEENEDVGLVENINANIISPQALHDTEIIDEMHNDIAIVENNIAIDNDINQNEAQLSGENIISRVNESESGNIIDPNCINNVNMIIPDEVLKSEPDSEISVFKEVDINESLDETENCLICLDSWTNSGNHRLVSLKCGHLFGQSCVEKWLRKQSRCPQCNSKAHLKDIRIIFAKSIKVVDTTERDRLAEELKREKEERKKAESEAAKVRMNLVRANSQYESMKREMEKLKRMNQIQESKKMDLLFDDLSTQPSFNGSYNLERSIEICTNGCRVLAWHNLHSFVCVSLNSIKPSLFPGFGIKKIDLHKLVSSEYLPMHSKPIRDLSFRNNENDNMLLSCSIDKTIKLTCLRSNKLLSSFECQAPVWSCIWSKDDPNLFFGGLQNGSVVCCDYRFIGSLLPFPLDDGSNVSRSPVVSLQYQQCSNANGINGLIVGQLEKSTFVYRKNPSLHLPYDLFLDGNLTSLSIDKKLNRLLASFRPTMAYPNVRHQLLELCWKNLDKSNDQLKNSFSTNLLKTIYGGTSQKLLSRSLLMKHPIQQNNDLLVCSADETSQSIKIWNSFTGHLEQTLKTNGQIIDVLDIHHQNYLTNFLFGLTESHLNVFKWTSN